MLETNCAEKKEGTACPDKKEILAALKKGNSSTILRKLKCAGIEFKEFIKKDTPQRKWGAAIFIIALLNFLLFFLCSAGAVSWPFMNVVANFFGILGGACLASGIFSALLGFTEFVNYTADVMAQILYRGEFIKNLTEDARNDLRLRLDTMKYGEDAIKTSKGPYEFLTKTYPQLYEMPFREEYTEISTYHIQAQLPHDSLWCVDNETTYTLRFAHTRLEWIRIPFGFTADYYDKRFFDYLDKNTHHVLLEHFYVDMSLLEENNKIKFRLDSDCGENYCLSVKNNKQWETVSKEKNKPTKINFENRYIDISANISFDVVQRDEVSSQKKRTVEFSGEILFRRECLPEGAAVVRMSQRSFECRLDHYTTLTLTYPTLNFFAEYNIEMKEDFIFSPRMFHFLNINEQLSEDINEVRMMARGWLLPGHGCGVSWRKVE